MGYPAFWCVKSVLDFHLHFGVWNQDFSPVHLWKTYVFAFFGVWTKFFLFGCPAFCSKCVKQVFGLCDTRWRKPTGCLKLHVIFRNRATTYRALLQKITCKDRASYGSSPPCTIRSPVRSCVKCTSGVLNMWNKYFTCVKQILASELCDTRSSQVICAILSIQLCDIKYCTCVGCTKGELLTVWNKYLSCVI